MDSAFRRPGRFDKIIFMPPPDDISRKETFKLHLAKKPIWEIDYDELAKKTSWYSGADIKAIIDETVESMIERSMKTWEIYPLETKDFLPVIKKKKPSVKEWFSTAKNYALYSNQSWIYDEINDYLKNN